MRPGGYVRGPTSVPLNFYTPKRTCNSRKSVLMGVPLRPVVGGPTGFGGGKGLGRGRER